MIHILQASSYSQAHLLEPIPKSGECKLGWIYLAPETYLHGRIGQGDRHFGIGS